MTAEKLREVISAYRAQFEQMEIAAVPYPNEEFLDTPEHGFQHCHGMLDQMEQFIAEGRTEKAYGWLCFIQGLLWRDRIYTLGELRNHNRSN